MALRTLQYAGNKTWTGQLEFCGQTVDVEVKCLGTTWRVTAGESVVNYESWEVGSVQIGGKWYLDFSYSWSHVELGIDPWQCPEPTGTASCFAEIYIPEGNISCGGD